MSGAGRIVTVRSASALAARATADCGSSFCARPLAARTSVPSEVPASFSIVSSRVSTSARSCACSTAVSRTRQVAAHSVIRPSLRAAIVQGISCTSAVAIPTNLPPRCGDSPRASATCSPTPRCARWFGTPAATCAARCETTSSAVTRACAAEAARFSSSSSRICSTRPASSPATSSVRTSATIVATGVGASSNTCSILLLSALRNNHFAVLDSTQPPPVATPEIPAT